MLWFILGIVFYYIIKLAVKYGVEEASSSIASDKFIDRLSDALINRIEEKESLDRKNKSKKILTDTIKECVGKECKIILDLVYVDDNGSGNIIKGIVRSVDEIWLRIEYINKNNENALKIIKLENITSIEII
ncbi:hypothetical protein K5V21_12770 [Clostridium sardiniense]|uniref:Uncharacterized protein n=1 Tax=Clostridium sardiniense TaxID=29369 RepID=A0ABS7KZT9_CLOSR|nr:hypothetical protein [Clostridium sardiniense]MBY0756321.1 hypothetical protein [Clostridium sardiniense]MDQ0461478.1 hypothetical protein [Clostridium sardiniense]